MRILVTGSRNWTDVKAIERALDDAVRDNKDPIVFLIHGGCRGADMLTDAIVRLRAEQFWVIEVYEANWKAYGNTAGFIRNQEMVDRKPDVCLAFIKPCQKSACSKPKPHDSHGAADCVERAKAAGVPVKEYR